MPSYTTQTYIPLQVHRPECTHATHSTHSATTTKLYALASRSKKPTVAVLQQRTVIPAANRSHAAGPPHQPAYIIDGTGTLVVCGNYKTVQPGKCINESCKAGQLITGAYQPHPPTVLLHHDADQRHSGTRKTQWHTTAEPPQLTGT